MKTEQDGFGAQESDMQKKQTNTIRNFQKEMDAVLQEWNGRERVPRLLLHSCCAPCSSYVLEYLTEHFEIVDFFYNPNISPAAEYGKRVEEIQRLIREIPLKHGVRFVEGRYDPGRFFEAVRGMENIPEGGERCAVCFELRLREAAAKAKELGCDYFATTLTISPLKNAAKLNEIGERIAQETGTSYLVSDFKKRGGYQRSIALSREYELYRQNYCGCIFSKMEAERQGRI